MKLNILKNNRFQALWIAVHGLVFLVLGVLFLCGTKFKINTNLFDILPKSNSSREVSKADGVINGKNGRTFVVFAKAVDFETAKTKAAELYDLLASDKNRSSFEELNLNIDATAVSEINDFYFNNRYVLLDEKTSESLYTQEGLDDFIAESQLNIFSGWVNTNNLEEDPFALGEVSMLNALSKVMSNGTELTMMDGVLYTYKDGMCYVMLRGLLSPSGASITNKDSGVKKIYDCAEKVKAACSKDEEVDFIYSGVPFHSYESSSSAQKEITVISVVSMVLIILLCLYIFRNVLPVVCSVGAITVSAVFALSSVLVVFGEIHILTFVFGTTLIGTCLDYSVHFFVRWNSDLELSDGKAVRSHLLKGLSLSLLSTEICYLLLCFAPFALLKQVAVFSFTGILSSYLTVLCLYPLLKNPKKKIEIPLTRKIEKIADGNSKIKKIILAAIITGSAVLCGIFAKNIRIENNLKSFYTMSGKLLEYEKEANTVLNSGSTGWYFIVKGDTKDQLMSNEENFCKKLDDYIEKSGNRNYTYQASTKFIPSIEAQKKSYAAIERLYPEIMNQYLLLGYGLREADERKTTFIQNHRDSIDRFIDPEGNIPQYMKNSISSLWIGKIDGAWYSLILPMHFENAEDCRNLAETDGNVYFMNKMADIGKELNVLTKLMLIFLAAAFVIMSIVLKFFYDWKKTAKIIAIPVITVFACVSVLGAFNVPLGFFSVTGIILVFGLSIDYIIYSVENSEALNTVAILLSFVSSALSFGALALSTFAPVFMFGLAVFVGLVTAVLCTVLVKGIFKE